MTDDDGDLALLGDQLERSFGAGPEGLPTPADRLAAGRRALQRRRRLTVAGTSVAVVVAIGLGVAASGVGGEHGADSPPPPLATQGTTASPSASATTAPRPVDEAAAEARAERRKHRQEQRLVSRDLPASFDIDGTVVVRDGWRINQRVENPMGFEPPEASLGVVVTDGNATRWMLLTLENQLDGQGNPTGDLGATAAADGPGKGYGSFEDWLASMVALNGGTKVQPLLTVDAADQLRPGPGAEIVATRPAPVVDGYTDAGDRMAEVNRDGRTWFVVVRGHGADAEVIPVDAAVLPEPTFAAFVDHVRSQVASGEGLR
jgi:hypothetical protein